MKIKPATLAYVSGIAVQCTALSFLTLASIRLGGIPAYLRAAFDFAMLIFIIGLTLMLIGLPEQVARAISSASASSSQSSSIRCECGHLNGDGATYCSDCGKRLR